MIKILKYLLQSLIVYVSFILGRILGLKISQQFFSKLFQFIGPKFKSKKIDFPFVFDILALPNQIRES